MATLPEFISEIGDEAAADLFGVQPRTARSWRTRDRYPRQQQAPMIVERTKGRVDYAGIYAPDPIDSPEDSAA